MKSTKKTINTAVCVVAAGKLALASHAVHADFTDGSKARQISITQGETTRTTASKGTVAIGKPLLEIDQLSFTSVTPKGPGSRGGSSGNISSSSSSTNIFDGTINLDIFTNATSEFVTEQLIVSGLTSVDNGPLDVYLVMSPTETDGLGWDDTASGFLLIDPTDFEILGKATVDTLDITEFPNSLTSTNPFNTSTTSKSSYSSISFSIPIIRQNVNTSFFRNNNIYIQAIAFPAGTFKWDDAVVSSLYKFSLPQGDGTGGTGKK